MPLSMGHGPHFDGARPVERRRQNSSPARSKACYTWRARDRVMAGAACRGERERAADPPRPGLIVPSPSVAVPVPGAAESVLVTPGRNQLWSRVIHPDLRETRAGNGPNKLRMGFREVEAEEVGTSVASPYVCGLIVNRVARWHLDHHNGSRRNIEEPA